MKKLYLTRIVWSVVVSCVLFINKISAQDTLNIIPSLGVSGNQAIGDAHQNIITGTWRVRNTYNNAASWFNTQEQIVSGIMTWDTLLNYGILILKRLSQAGIAMGSLMLIYVGYQYIMSVIAGTTPDNKLIPRAMSGILVIIFSYAIMRILVRTFLT